MLLGNQTLESQISITQRKELLLRNKKDNQIKTNKHTCAFLKKKNETEKVKKEIKLAEENQAQACNANKSLVN